MYFPQISIYMHYRLAQVLSTVFTSTLHKLVHALRYLHPLQISTSIYSTPNRPKYFHSHSSLIHTDITRQLCRISPSTLSTSS